MNAFPRGAPSIACGSYIPSHGALVQSPETAPYTVVADRNYFDFREAGADRVVGEYNLAIPIYYYVRNIIAALNTSVINS